MIWKELLDYLKSLEENDDNRLGDSVMVWDIELGEYYPADTLEIEDQDDIIEFGHLFISINGG